MEYTKEYFIEKFSEIPEKEIGVVALELKCSLWHCGVRREFNRYVATQEALALIKLFGGVGEEYKAVYDVNDGWRENKELGATPKERILNKLKSL